MSRNSCSKKLVFLQEWQIWKPTRLSYSTMLGLTVSRIEFKADAGVSEGDKGVPYKPVTTSRSSADRHGCRKCSAVSREWWGWLHQWPQLVAWCCKDSIYAISRRIQALVFWAFWNAEVTPIHNKTVMQHQQQHWKILASVEWALQIGIASSQL